MIPCRTTGDVLISYNVGGGSKVSVVFYRWVTDTSASVVIPPDPTPPTRARRPGTSNRPRRSRRIAAFAGAMNSHGNHQLPDRHRQPADAGQVRLGQLRRGGAQPDRRSSTAPNSARASRSARCGCPAARPNRSTRSCRTTSARCRSRRTAARSRAASSTTPTAAAKTNRQAGTGWLDDPAAGRQRDQSAADHDHRRGGSYSFTNVPPGTYVVREVGQSGWTCDYPGTGSAAATR